MYKIKHLGQVVPVKQTGVLTVEKDGALWVGTGHLVVKLDADKLPPTFMWIRNMPPGAYQHRAESGFIEYDGLVLRNILTDARKAAHDFTVTDRLVQRFDSRNADILKRVLASNGAEDMHVNEKYLDAVHRLAEDSGRPVASLWSDGGDNAISLRDAEGDLIAIIMPMRR